MENPNSKTEGFPNQKEGAEQLTESAKTGQIQVPSAEIERALLQGSLLGSYALIVTDHLKPGEPIAYVNSAFEVLTGYTLAEVLGLGFPGSNDQNRPGVQKLEDAMRAGRAGSAILHTNRKDKTAVWCQVEMTPVFSQEKILTHFIGFFQDVSAMVDSKKEADARDTFIATLAHDLKTPLASADRMFALINDGACGAVAPQLHKAMVLLCNDNKKALALVKNLLESYRLNNDSGLLHFEALDMSALIESSVCEIQAITARPKIHVKAGDKLPSFKGDELAIGRLITNLLDNAVKFTPENGSVQISGEQIEDKIVLKVIDTGIGIPNDDRELVFEKFKRSNAANRYTPGCGLGLYICKEIVAAHHGQISFQSQHGVGTMFTVILPI